MKKITLLLSLFSSIALTSFGQSFPYSNSLSSTLGLTMSGAFIRQEGLQLISGSGTSTYMYFKDLNFSTEEGFVVNFSFVCTLGGTYDGKYGDGFTLALFDSSIPIPTVGTNGSGLGYAFNRSATVKKQGFSGGYLGIGFDAFGRFKNFMNDGTDWRNGIPGLSNLNKSIGENITIRGPYRNARGVTASNTAITNNYFEGYPVLVSQNVMGADTSKFVLNTETGLYSFSSNQDIAPFSLHSSKSSLSIVPGTDEYRAAKISMIPGTTNNNTEKGFYLNVSVTHGTQTEEVIKNFFIPTSRVTIKYPEIILSSIYPPVEESTNQDAYVQIQDLDITPPSALKMGFTASNGAAYQTVILKNFSVALPFSPEVFDEQIFGICDKINSTSSFAALRDDLGYLTSSYKPGSPPKGSFYNLDIESLRFKTIDGNGSYTVSDLNNGHTVNGIYGTLTFNPQTQIFYYQRNTTAVNPSTAIDYFYFDIKNKKSDASSTIDLTADKYRSRTAALALSFSDDCPAPANVYVKINK